MRSFSLADDDEHREVSPATVPYPPLYSETPYLSALRFWREGERRSVDASDLFQRGAEQVVHNTELYESRRNSSQEVRGANQDEAGPSTHPNEEIFPAFPRGNNEPAASVTRERTPDRQEDLDALAVGCLYKQN